MPVILATWEVEIGRIWFDDGLTPIVGCGGIYLSCQILWEIQI
jgi:hypothetical protein